MCCGVHAYGVLSLGSASAAISIASCTRAMLQMGRRWQVGARGAGTNHSQEIPVRAIFAFVVMGVVLLAQPAAAQTYPSKPIHVLVPYAPGGPADIAARVVGAKLTEAWGQQVVVENRPGGNGFIAMSAAAKAAPDGYTLVLATIGEAAVSPVLVKEAPYSIQREFAPISLISDATIVLATHGEAPFH